MAATIIPNVVYGQTVRQLSTDGTALEASRLMVEHDISAIAIVDELGQLVGIVTERDLARRVAALDLRSSEQRLADIMTANPTTAAPNDSPHDALRRMIDLHIRHLPIVEGKQVVGMISMRDLRRSLRRRARGPRWLRRIKVWLGFYR